MDCNHPETSQKCNPAHYLHVVVDESTSGLRLDHFLVHHFPDCSRAKITASIRSGSFVVDDIIRKSSYKLKKGEIVTGQPEEAAPLEVVAEKIDFPILFEDEYLIVLSKPPGLVVHPGSGNSHGTLVNGLVYYCNEIAEVGEAIRPGIVHRLDKDTSGIMVVAKSDDTHNRLTDAFKERTLQKEYIALVHGILEPEQGRINAPIGRHPVNRQRMAVRDPGGKYAASNWQVLDYAEKRYTLIKVGIETGRTHQIRVHMKHVGHPIAGDTLYGGGRDNSMFPRQLLHASRLAFNHPFSGKKMSFKAPLWEDFERVLAGFSWCESSAAKDL